MPRFRLHDDSQVYRGQTETEMDDAFDEDDMPIVYEMRRESPLS
jgi:hypothetical protein